MRVYVQAASYVASKVNAVSHIVRPPRQSVNSNLWSVEDVSRPVSGPHFSRGEAALLTPRFIVVIQIMQIEFDAAKRAATLEARGLDMVRAGEVFSGATLTVENDRRDYGEDRFITVGFPDVSMVVVVWTPRNIGARIISMRKAHDREQRLYGERFRPGYRTRLVEGWLAGKVCHGGCPARSAAGCQAESIDHHPAIAGCDRSLPRRREGLADTDRRGAS